MQRHFYIFLFVTLLSASAAFAQTGHGVTGQDNNLSGQVDEEASPYIPNAFTPNQDGINDEFYITNADFPKFNFTVFDRWGNRVYATTNGNFRWDGTQDGDPVASGTYVFVMEAVSAKGKQLKRSGTISIVR
jgi:gliding motility-associated-like protein